MDANCVVEVEKMKKILMDEFRAHQRVIRSAAVELQTCLKKKANEMSNSLESFYKDKCSRLDEIILLLMSDENGSIEDLDVRRNDLYGTVFGSHLFDIAQCKSAIESLSITYPSGLIDKVTLPAPQISADIELEVIVPLGITRTGIVWLCLSNLSETSKIALGELSKRISFKRLTSKNWKSFADLGTSPAVGSDVLVDGINGWSRGLIERKREDNAFGVRLRDFGDLIFCQLSVLFPPEDGLLAEFKYQSVACRLSINSDQQALPIEAVWAFNDAIKENTRHKNTVTCKFKNKVTGQDNEELWNIDLLVKNKNGDIVSLSEIVGKAVDDKVKGKDAIACRDIRYSAQKCTESRYIERPKDEVEKLSEISSAVETSVENATKTEVNEDPCVGPSGDGKSEFPELVKVLPAVAEAVPAVAEAVPAVAEAVPAVAEAVPAVENLVPAVRRVVPAMVKTVPAVTEVARIVAEAVANGAKAVPAEERASSCYPMILRQEDYMKKLQTLCLEQFGSVRPGLISLNGRSDQIKEDGSTKTTMPILDQPFLCNPRNPQTGSPFPMPPTSALDISPNEDEQENCTPLISESVYGIQESGIPPFCCPYPTMSPVNPSVHPNYVYPLQRPPQFYGGQNMQPAIEPGLPHMTSQTDLWMMMQQQQQAQFQNRFSAPHVGNHPVYAADELNGADQLLDSRSDEQASKIYAPVSTPLKPPNLPPGADPFSEQSGYVSPELGSVGFVSSGMMYGPRVSQATYRNPHLSSSFTNPDSNFGGFVQPVPHGLVQNQTRLLPHVLSPVVPPQTPPAQPPQGFDAEEKEPCKVKSPGLYAIDTSPGAMFSGRVTTIEEDGRLWIQVARDTHKKVESWETVLTNMRDNDRYGAHVKADEVLPGKLYLAINPGRQNLCRAEVLSLKDRKAILRCVDTGHTITAMKDSLKQLQEKVSSFPRQAVRCCLVDHNLEIFNENARKSLECLIKGKMVKAIVRWADPDCLDVFGVELCEIDGTKVCDILHTYEGSNVPQDSDSPELLFHTSHIATSPGPASNSGLMSPELRDPNASVNSQLLGGFLPSFQKTLLCDMPVNLFVPPPILPLHGAQILGSGAATPERCSGNTEVVNQFLHQELHSNLSPLASEFEMMKERNEKNGQLRTSLLQNQFKDEERPASSASGSSASLGHLFDAAPSDGTHPGGHGPQQQQREMPPKSCHECGEIGHIKRFCPLRQRPPWEQPWDAEQSNIPVLNQLFAAAGQHTNYLTNISSSCQEKPERDQPERRQPSRLICFNCGEPGHGKNNCTRSGHARKGHRPGGNSHNFNNRK